MRFIKENPALAAGIGLPFLLVIFFSLSTAITQWAVEPPKHDMFFTVNTSNCIGGEAMARFDFSEGKVKAKYSYPKSENNYVNCYENQKLYRFSVANLSSSEITFEIPKKNDSIEIVSGWREFEIPELKNIQITNNVKAPDGYEFITQNNYHSGGIFLFSGGYGYRDIVVIKKNGRNVKIAPFGNRYYSYSDINFLGWVVSEGSKQ